MPNPAWVSAQSVGGTVGTSIGFTNNSNGLTLGNALVLAIGTWWDSGVPGKPTVTDNHGNTYVWLAGGANVSLDGTRTDIYACPPLAASYSTGTYTATAVTAEGGGTHEIYGQLSEWSGFGTGGIALDVSGFTTYGAATSSVSVTLSAATSKQAVEAIICLLHFNDDTNPDGIATNPGGTGTWSHGGSITDASANLAIGTSSQVTSATGTAYTATWSGLNTSTNNGGTATIVALYPASAGLNIAFADTERADTMAANIPDQTAPQLGMAVLDFGSAPGSNQASVAVTGIASILATSKAEAYIMADDLTVDHSASDHRYAGLWLKLSCSTPTAAVGFTLVAKSTEYLQGTFKVRWVWGSGGTDETYFIADDRATGFLTDDTGSVQLTSQ